ncbi:MAG: DUF6036 family nucleotidyltransferase [Mycobacteriales bacterium]
MTEPIDLPPIELDPEAILGALDRHHVDYVLVGGYAVILQGVDTRVTYDLDVVPEAGDENLRRLGAALIDLHARVITFWDPDTDELHVDRSDFAPQLFRDNPFLHLLTDSGRLDVLMAPGGYERGYTDLSSHAEEETIRGIPIRLASLEDLITMKEAVRRPRDERDLKQLYLIRDSAG